MLGDGSTDVTPLLKIANQCKGRKTVSTRVDDDDEDDEDNLKFTVYTVNTAHTAF